MREAIYDQAILASCHDEAMLSLHVTIRRFYVLYVTMKRFNASCHGEAILLLHVTMKIF